MNAYWDFAEWFYAEVPLIKPIDRRRGYQLFELHDRRIIVAAFDSICNNDCFGYSGAINPGAVARCNLDLRDSSRFYDLRIAVWHHSTQGPPARDDYMEVGQVLEMAGLRFQLGMHGHQHIAATTTHYVHVSESQSMAVVSAGSLCAGSNELPRGVNRQYNLVVIEDGFHRARVHVREMVEGEQFSRKSNGPFGQGFIELTFPAKTDAMGREIDVEQENVRRLILQADEELHLGNPGNAIDLLQSIDLSRASHARNIAIDSALKLYDWVLLVTLIDKPQSTEEAVLLVSGLIHTDALAQAADVLRGRPEIAPATRNDLEDQIEMKRIVRGR